MKNARVIRRPEVNNQQVRTTMIRGTSRMSVKIRDNYYTVEFTEERSVPNNPNIDLEQEKQLLFDSVQDTVYSQVQEIINGLN